MVKICSNQSITLDICRLRLAAWLPLPIKKIGHHQQPLLISQLLAPAHGERSHVIDCKAFDTRSSSLYSALCAHLILPPTMSPTASPFKVCYCCGLNPTTTTTMATTANTLLNLHLRQVQTQLTYQTPLPLFLFSCFLHDLILHLTIFRT